MEIKSKAFVEPQINPEIVIDFPNGIPGFEDQTQFQLFQQEDSKIVYLLQSVQDEYLTLPVAHPSSFNINYQFALSDDEESTLDLESIADLLILLILHKDSNIDSPSQPTIKGSIKSPLLINTKKRIGIQKIISTIEQSITFTEKDNEIDLIEA
ncbi:MAG: flagellar assembly protein FliW [Methylococcales bacterium]|nr:flagellar assembly protein FliW [Methylococcales bacterium]